MNSMMENMATMMVGMGLLTVIVVVALVVVTAAVVKYLFFDKREKDR